MGTTIGGEGALAHSSIRFCTSSVLQVVMCPHGLGCLGEVTTTSEVEAEVGMTMTGAMADIRIVLQVRTLPLCQFRAA
jgi:hypothetical protein